MKFYAREKELQILEKMYEQAGDSGVMTVLTGRRRFGKTVLARKYAENKKQIYLFVSKKSEKLLCGEFIEIIKDRFDIPVLGEVRDFKTIFKLVLELAIEERIVLIIDEFQEFYKINPAVYSEVQNLWDEYKYKSRIHLIVIGSMYSLMTKIFQNSHEPLFGRADRLITLKPFSVVTIKKILEDQACFSEENLLFNFIVTGGIPRYEDILVRNKAFSTEEVIELFFDGNSPFIEEGKTVLVEEFGKDYGIYFSILALLSEGRTSRSEIESILEKSVGGHLDRLEETFAVIRKIKPVGSKATSRIQKYGIRDNFLNFWFRFVYKYRSAIEQENYRYVIKLLKRDLNTYSGPCLEKIYLQLFQLKGEYNILGTYWEKGNMNEIDLIAINEYEKEIKIAEIKLKRNKVNLNTLKRKSANLIKHYSGFDIEYLALGLEDLSMYM